MNGRQPCRLLVTLLVVAAAAMPACRAIGPSRVSPDRFDYNQAIARSTNEQMLLNLVRLRYSETPTFLAVSSVLTQYIYSGSLRVAGAGGASMGAPLWSAGGSGALVYVERPTITYTPLAGDDFATQMLGPISTELLFSLVGSGWPPDLLLLMGLYRINETINVGFQRTPANIHRFEAFRDLVQQIIALGKRDAIEVQEEPVKGSDEPARFFVFPEDPDPQTRALIQEFKEAAAMDPNVNRFRITTHFMNRRPDEMTLRVRSILELMGFLCQGVAIDPCSRSCTSSSK